MPVKTKILLSGILNEHRIRFGNNHNHVMVIIQEPIHLLN